MRTIVLMLQAAESAIDPVYIKFLFATPGE